MAGRVATGHLFCMVSCRRLPVGLLVLALLAPGGARRAAAQAGGARGGAGPVVSGTVQDESGRPLAGASVRVAGSAADVESDETGRFALRGLRAGQAVLVARRIGFAPETLRVEVGASGEALAPLRLRRVAVPLEAVVVRGRRDLRGPIAGFYARMERGGGGRFFTHEQIDRRNVQRLSDLLRGIPGMRIEQRRSASQSVRMRGATAAPLVWLDGAPMGAGEVDLDVFDPMSFAGIEVYSGPASVPAEFAGHMGMSTSGGAILLWSRQGEPRAPRRRRGAPTPAAVIFGLLERGEAFTSAQVDRVAAPDGEPAVPIYPDSLFRAGAAGWVEVEFVVTAQGTVRFDTFGVVATTHRTLGEAVRRALQTQAFVPAERGKQPVAQLVQLPFEFLPDSGVVVRKPKD